MTTYRDRVRLGEAVERARQNLGLSQDAIARRAGIAKNSWTRVEIGERAARWQTYRAVERALGWEPFTCQRILDGQPAEPVPQPVEVDMDTPGVREFVAATRDMTPEEREQLAQLGLLALRLAKDRQRRTSNGV